MGFVKTAEELGHLGTGEAYFYGVQMVRVAWETKPEIIANLLPAPLEPAEMPLVIAFLADYPRTSFGPPYQEGALIVQAQFEDPAMQLTPTVGRDDAVGEPGGDIGQERPCAILLAQYVFTGQCAEFGFSYRGWLTEEGRCFLRGERASEAGR